MGRKLDVDLLVGAAEIGERLDVDRNTLHVWRARYSKSAEGDDATKTEPFPAPVRELAQGHLWYWPDVERWARHTGRHAGGPSSD